MRVQDADDLDPLPFPPKDDQVRAAWVNSHRRCELLTFSGHFRKLGQQVEERERPVRIALRLVYAPGRGALEPDVHEIGFRRGPDGPAAISRHARPAFGT